MCQTWWRIISHVKYSIWNGCTEYFRDMTTGSNSQHVSEINEHCIICILILCLQEMNNSLGINWFLQFWYVNTLSRIFIGNCQGNNIMRICIYCGKLWRQRQEPLAGVIFKGFKHDVSNLNKTFLSCIRKLNTDWRLLAISDRYIACLKKKDGGQKSVDK